MNYMEQVAKMLGVEIGEYFQITCNPNYFFLCYDGLVCNESGHMVNGVLNDLLIGKLKIKRKPWKPHHGDTYYCISSQGCVLEEKWYGDVIDTLYYKLGNCYKTRDVAEPHCDRWLAFYKSDDVLEI